jgi:hypothetical protein
MFHVKHWRRTETANLGTSKSPSFACASEIVSCETFPHPMFCSLLPFNQSPFTIRYSPFATRCLFGSAGASPSHDFRRLKSALSFFVND